MYSIQHTGQFKKDLKRLKKRSRKNFAVLQEFIEELVISGLKEIPSKHRPHILIGNYRNCYECHVQTDLLLIWQEDCNEMIITLIRTGTHADLF